ncbi:RagB/SusD family nutrient uptake outer membrane protein [Pedobacter sp. L105]|uniref:RagB/SusD family nutrient uptake outer membrane protein n=1 Tax=Pedobacter sp. L105 TaxID=1641871 RepID=UPI00131CF69F|nr:RagB/SusD family nutrient uptake outer membrane protein [Pedobacter sp. L105]
MKNFRNNYIITGGIIASLLLGSCKKDFLDQKPYTSVAAGDAVKTEADLQLALTGAYANLRSSNLYGRTLPVFGDLLADNVFVSSANSGRYISENTYTVVINDGDVAGVWTDAYSTILRANNIIDAALTGGATVNQIKGEAYAIRALVYFDLVRAYGKPYTDDPNSPGVPIVLHYDPKALPTRNTVAEAYTQILSDLDQAYSLMTAYNGSGTFSKYAARGLAAKVNLNKGDYQKALDEAKDVITASGFSLVGAADLAGYWAAATPHDSGTKQETLFEVVSDAVNNNSYDELSNIYVQGGTSYGDLLTTKSVYDLYSATDVRKALILIGVRQKTGGENPAYIVNKYPVVTGDFNDKKVLRLSDVYLVAAEAANRLGSGDATTYLNTLVAQRDPSLVYASTGAQQLTDIITERRKELAFEGDRFYDLNRLKLDINRGAEYSTGVIKYGDTRRVLPIPQSELNVNPNVAQNPGY